MTGAGGMVCGIISGGSNTSAAFFYLCFSLFFPFGLGLFVFLAVVFLLL
jgi:hypothetical protein